MIIIVLYYLHVHMQWSGIVTNWYSEFAGLQFKVQTSGKIREHFEVSPDRHNFNYATIKLILIHCFHDFQKAIELDPKEPFVPYLLGRWYEQ